MKKTKIVSAVLALVLTTALIPSATVESSASGFDPKSVGGTGSNSIGAWKEINDEVVGWFKIPGTNVNWPVVVGENNNEYLEIDYYKNKNKNSVIWADSDSTFGTKKDITRNTVLYGHNWTNISANPRIGDPKDVMFGQVPAFHHLDFARKTPYIHYSTEEANMTWKVFAVYYTDLGFPFYNSTPNDKQFKEMIDTAKRKSLHNYDVDVDVNDKIITLSTCTRAYGNTANQRFVVMARLLRDGEKIEEVSITENKNFERPKV